MLKSALNYLRNGYSIIPINPDDKKPYEKFKQYQTELPTEEKVREWWSKYPNANIGLLTGESWDLFVIDVDKYKPEYSEEIALQLIPDNIITPTAVSPRGGNHLYFSYPKGEKISIRSDDKLAIDYRGTGGYIIAPPSKNGNGRSYRWTDGLSLFEMPRTQPPNQYIEYIKKYNIYKGDHSLENPYLPQTTTPTTNDHKMFVYGSRDQDLFHTANCLVKGGMNRPFIYQVLERLIFSWGENSDPNWINAKIKSALERAANRERNWAEETKEFVATTNGYFSTTECHNQLQATTKEAKKAINMALLRMVPVILEKHGSKNGCYRKIDDNTDEETEFMETIPEEFPIRLPLDLNEMCKLFPRNIIVIAGTKGAGKTSFLLNVAIANQNQHEVVYFNSEMGDEEWTERLRSFGFKSRKDQKFKAPKRSQNFHDKMDGSKKLYIIDFLEIHENFFEIAKPIRLIHEKLGDGICVIGIQKNPKSELSYGGVFSAEKARLYLTLDYVPELQATKFSIYDAKVPKIVGGVKGFFRNVKIIGGAKLSPLDNWRR